MFRYNVCKNELLVKGVNDVTRIGVTGEFLPLFFIVFLIFSSLKLIFFPISFFAFMNSMKTSL